MMPPTKFADLTIEQQHLRRIGASLSKDGYRPRIRRITKAGMHEWITMLGVPNFSIAVITDRDNRTRWVVTWLSFHGVRTEEYDPDGLNEIKRLLKAYIAGLKLSFEV
jgi:hypothetical protein